VNEAGDYHAAVAADGTVYWASADRPDGLGRSDVYAAAPDGDGYADPMHLPVNSPTSEPDLYIDPEQRFMILTVTDRAGGLGGDDLWLSRREGGAWGELVHLGDLVNTPEYEYGPYVHDGWLYFTSHRSGQADIYRARLVDLPGLAEFVPGAGPAAFVPRDLEVDGRRLPVTVQLPPGYDGERAWPTILALHGGGSRGTDGMRHRGQSIAAAARTWPDRYPAVLVLPQIPEGTWWLNGYLPAAEAALDLAAREFRLDPDRTYVVGQSMGAAGALALAARNPDRFAAAISVAGPNPGSLDVAALRDVPVWLFHGARDPVVAAEDARGLLRRLREAGVEARWTEYPEGRHDIFDAVYGDEEVSAWLMEQRRGD
jgi:predicted esterase